MKFGYKGKEDAETAFPHRHSALRFTRCPFMTDRGMAISTAMKRQIDRKRERE
jgi:hypothetical protein